MDFTKQAELTAEAFAASFIEEHFGHDLFIGPHIEQILADKATIIYQYVEDDEYFGASVQHKNGEQFIALNTFHTLRLRYFTAAHELWHLSEGSQYQGVDFDHKRAADRFAAAIMLPKALTLELWKKFKKLYNAEEAIFHIADFSAVPYVAVVRRLSELNESVNGAKLKEVDWLNKRLQSNLPESSLDQAKPYTCFRAYEKIVQETVKQNNLDLLSAANKLAKFSPKQAEIYQQQEQLRIHEASEDYEA